MKEEVNIYFFDFQRYVDCTVLGRGSAATGAEAEDSSYDSDFEAEDSIGSTVVHPQLEAQVSSSTHSDVSRTTSDTLAAEFAEYVTVQGVSPTQSPGKREFTKNENVWNILNLSSIFINPQLCITQYI